MKKTKNNKNNIHDIFILLQEPWLDGILKNIFFK